MKTLENAFILLLKFGSDENLRKLQSGQLYMKNLQYYIDLEKTSSDEDVGDLYDGQALILDSKISMFSHETGDLIMQFTAPNMAFNLGYLKAPVFCMFSLDYRNATGQMLNGDVLNVRYDFTKEQVKKMTTFGDSVLVIKNGDEFMARVKKGLLSNSFGFSRDFVSYYDGNILQHLQEIYEDNSRITFWKRQKYAYQQEYRIIAHTEVDGFLSIDIGDLSDITQLVKAETLFNTYLEIDFKVDVLTDD